MKLTLNNLDIGEKIELGETGLSIKRGLSFPEWELVGQFLKKANKSVQFWLGDWLNYGEQKYGEMYAQAVDATDYEQGTLANFKYVSARIEISRRREDLPWAHHAEVASLEPEAQEAWLKAAAEEGLSSRHLRNKIKKAKAIEKPEEDNGLIECPNCKFRFKKEKP